MKSTPIDIRNNSLSLLKNNLTLRKISKKYNIRKSIVYKLQQKYLPNLKVNQASHYKKISSSLKRICIRAITNRKYRIPKEITSMLLKDKKIKVSCRTIRRTLNEAGLSAAEKQKKPRLSKANIKTCLNFAQVHKHWTVED